MHGPLRDPSVNLPSLIVDDALDDAENHKLDQPMLEDLDHFSGPYCVGLYSKNLTH